jgi:disulfide oxidoreductase YuzD
MQQNTLNGVNCIKKHIAESGKRHSEWLHNNIKRLYIKHLSQNDYIEVNKTLQIY